MKMVVENIFMCCGSILKMLFSYKFFTFSQLFSQHPNKFYYKKFQNHSQIPTPHITETPIQPTAANSGNQKPQPPKHHYHTTTTTTKIKITERDRWVEGSGSKARSSGEIESRGVIGVVLWSTKPVRSGACGHWIGARGSLAMSKAWSGLPLLPLARALSLSLSLSLFACLTQKWFEVKIFISNHFQGQSLILHGQLQITSGKFIFHAQPNTRIYEKTFPKVIWSQNKHSLKDNAICVIL